MKIKKIKKNSDKRVLLIMLIMLSVCWMCVIYMFSSQSGEESGGLSDRVALHICEAMSIEISPNGFELLTFIIRKVAHFTEYAVLGLLYMSVIVVWDKIVRYRLVISTSLCMVYAMTDEFHQSFTAGRSPAVNDVIIDTVGGLFGGAVCLLIWYIIWRRTLLSKDRES